MIAAAIPQFSDKGSILRLALEIIASHRQIPEDLADETNLIFRSGVELAIHPRPIQKREDPEALRLAIRLRSSKELMHSLQGVDDLRSLESTTASEILRTMDSKVARLI